jgi:pyrroline-5-carboxylate reductase
MKKSIGFIGGGRVTKIFLQAFANKNVNLDNVVVYDINADTLFLLKKEFHDITIVTDPAQSANQEIVIIALHPPAINETLEKITNDIKESTILVSFAPKITVAKIEAKLKSRKIIRMIPNATSYINEGYNPMYFSGGFAEEEKSELIEMLKILGNNFEVAEEKLEAYALISAMLPTYFWFQWNDLKLLGSQMGLSDDESKTAVHQTLISAINLMFKSGLAPEQLIDLIPVKPIGEHEAQISEIYHNKLLGLYEKIKP